MSDGQRPAETEDAATVDEVRPTVPVRQAGPSLAVLAVAVLCAACIAIGFALGRTL